jgi:hypothetical protein
MANRRPHPPPAALRRRQLANAHNPLIGYFVYETATPQPSPLNAAAAAPTLATLTADASRHTGAVLADGLSADTSGGLEAFCRLQALQRHQRRAKASRRQRQHQHPRTRQRPAWGKPGRAASPDRLPAHNPNMGFFRHDMEDPIVQFLRDCAPATHATTLRTDPTPPWTDKAADVSASDGEDGSIEDVSVD